LAFFKASNVPVTVLTSNAFNDATGWKYKTTDPALQYEMDGNGGTYKWFQAASGTAGDPITFTQAMTLDASGNLGIGTSSPSVRLHIKGPAQTVSVLRLEPSTSTTIYSQVQGNNGDLTLQADPGNAEGSTSMRFEVDGTERMRIDSSGYLRLAGGGIQFNGDTAAANALDDYEEGTWTPVISDGTNNATMGVSAQGRYTKIGNLVTVTGYAVTTALGLKD
jgi:hypothetical protein